ncbi:MAG: hypothetical protein ACX939_12525 [Hyphococcus sp.]
MCKKVFMSLVVLMVASPAAYAETIVGRWCDQMIPNNPKFRAELSIVIKDNGDVVMRSKYADGSGGTYPLNEIGNDMYEQQNSRHGDKYRIVRSTGELQLLDNDGLIRTAKRLENTPHRGDCLS